jgi:hypothetical protein
VNRQVRRYRRRLPECNAIFYDGTNGEEVAAWCGGRTERVDEGGETVVLVLVGSSVHPVRPGWYVVEEHVPGDLPHH